MNKREIQTLAAKEILSAINRHHYRYRFWLALHEAISPHGTTQPSENQNKWYKAEIESWKIRINKRISNLEQTREDD